MSNGFLLDTNVLSELMRERPATAVLDWFAQNTQGVMHTSTVTQAEILTGIALLPAGKRRTALAVAAEQMFEHDFAGRCRAFDAAAARNYAVIVAARSLDIHIVIHVIKRRPLSALQLSNEKPDHSAMTNWLCFPA